MTSRYLVAAKTVKLASTGLAASEELLQEATCMAQIGPHRNLVSLVGVVTKGLPKMILVSFCEHGALHSLLRGRRAAGDPLTVATKFKMACRKHTAAQRFTTNLLENTDGVHRPP